jgi:hypothetical protein
MDDDDIGGGILIASEDDLNAMFAENQLPFNIDTVPGRNIKTGCYGLFLVALDQCDDPTEKGTLEEAIDALDNLRGCLVGCALTIYYPKLDIDYAGILSLAETIIYLSDVAPMLHVREVPEDKVGEIDQQVGELLNINAEEAIKEFFGAMGFTPVEIPNDGPRQTELDFGT